MKEISIKLSRHPLHLDYFLDYKNRIGQVLSWFQPKEKLISIIKYEPGEGFWVARDTGLRYQRILKSYSLEGQQDNLNFIARKEKEYLFYSNVFGTNFLAVPLNKIKRYFYPEERLKEIHEGKKRDSLEEKVRLLTQLLHERLNIPYENLGISGSILWKGQTKKSDIDLIIYGNSIAHEFNKRFSEIYDIYPEIQPMPPEKSFRYARSMALKSGLPTELTKKYIAKKTWLSVFGETNLSFIFSPTPEELPFKYGEEKFQPLESIDLECTITNAALGFAYPAVYEISNCSVVKGDDHNLSISRIFSYEGALTGYFESGDQIVVRGLLEKVLPENKIDDIKGQIMLGTKECHGNEFILFKEDYEKKSDF